jgi:mevalonate kinase
MISSIPGKTFLIGEYVAMYGGPAVLALTQPCFHLDEQKRLHPNCLAARLWQKETGQPCNWGLSDPYSGMGGLGASSAEFLLAYMKIFGENTNLSHLHSIFFQYADTGTGGRIPSGYDLFAQTSEQCVIVQSNPPRLQSLFWPFAELGFILVHTRKKLQTHQHLENLHLDLQWRELAVITERAIVALLEKDCEQWLRAIQLFYNKLQHQGLVAAHTVSMIKDWMQELPILAAKGCGAMGADVVVLFTEVEKIDSIVDYLTAHGAYILATNADLYQKNSKK